MSCSVSRRGPRQWNFGWRKWPTSGSIGTADPSPSAHRHVETISSGAAPGVSSRPRPAMYCSCRFALRASSRIAKQPAVHSGSSLCQRPMLLAHRRSQALGWYAALHRCAF
eukprot:1171109-Prymnesium_polylepis.1